MITGKRLIKKGWPEGRVIGEALRLADVLTTDGLDEDAVYAVLERIRTNPDACAEDDPGYGLAHALIARRAPQPTAVRDEPLHAPIWGATIIDPQAIEQLHHAMRLPVTVGGALMPDAHVGYGIPIGGVVALDNAVAPYMVGVDIACFPGNTKIPTLAGVDRTLQELADSRERFGVWACTPSGKLVAAWATAMKTREAADLLEVTLDNGERVQCTPDHEFMRRDGSFVRADALKPGTSLMPFYSQLDPEGYLRIKQNYSGKWQRAHWIVARSGLMGEVPRFEEQRTVIHHKDFNCETCGEKVKSGIGLHNHRKWVPGYNHRVVAVEPVDGTKDVFCLNVPGHANFALSVGVFVHNCRMMMSIYLPSSAVMLENASKKDQLRKAMREETRFGLGAKFDAYERRQHAVLDDPDWEATRLLKHLKDKAYAQLGTSGTGNHFVDAGILRVDDAGAAVLGLEPGAYLAIMTHSGSRGPGASIANHYSRLAQDQSNLPKALRHLAWLSLDTEAGQEYWVGMNLAGRFASACHHTIHRALAKRLGLKPVLQVENHHNFAFKEIWQGKEVYVHRKGATPAHEGVLGIIPGSQGHNSYIVRGLGNEASLNSASHGAGRQMSRTQAKQTIPRKQRDAWLKERGVELMAGGMDEAPQAYKDIREVLALQADLAEPVATFQPRLVLMADDGKSEG